MTVYLLFGQRVEDYPGQCAPELLDAVDEYTLEGNLGCMDEAIEAQRRLHGDQMVAMEWFEVTLPSTAVDTIRDSLLNLPKIEGVAKIQMLE